MDDDFESMFDEEILNEPVYEDDIDQYGESLNNAMLDLRLLFSRTRIQYQGDTWISQELWNQYCLLDQAYERMVTLLDHGLFKKPQEPTAPGQNTYSRNAGAQNVEKPIDSTQRYVR